MIKDLNSNEFDMFINESKVPVLVDFWAPWCGPCRMMSPVLGALNIKYKDKMAIVKINVDNEENNDLAMKFNIRSIPNLKLFKNGTVIADFVGYKDQESLEGLIEKYL